MTALAFALLLIVFAWRLGSAYDKRRQKPLVTYHWDGGWLADGRRVKNPFQPDGLPSDTAETAPPPRLNTVGEGG